MPDVAIKGNDIGHQGYYFIKLPFDDPIVYVLGQLDQGCMWVDGVSRYCIFDGVTRENNGFYILLKNKSKSAKKAEYFTLEELVVDGKIDYKKCSIVGYGYGWRSGYGNFVFDSWENKNPDNDDEVSVDFLENFSKNVASDVHSSILCINIGQKGKTPAKWRKGSAHNLQETKESIKEGWSCYDSANQSWIYIDENKHNAWINELKTKAKQINIPQNIIDKIITKKNIYSMNQYKELSLLLEFKQTRGLLEFGTIYGNINKIEPLSLDSFLKMMPQKDRYVLIKALSKKGHLENMIWNLNTLETLSDCLEKKEDIFEIIPSKKIAELFESTNRNYSVFLERIRLKINLKNIKKLINNTSSIKSFNEFIALVELLKEKEKSLVDLLETFSENYNEREFVLEEIIGLDKVLKFPNFNLRELQRFVRKEVMDKLQVKKAIIALENYLEKPSYPGIYNPLAANADELIVNKLLKQLKGSTSTEELKEFFKNQLPEVKDKNLIEILNKYKELLVESTSFSLL